MKKRIIAAIVLAVFLAGGAAWAQKTVRMSFGLSLPPYVFTDSTGMEYEIIKRALELKGYTLKPNYVPFARLPVSLEDKSADAAATVNEASGLYGVHFSESHITYQNVAISLAAKKFAIKGIPDLVGKSVLAFQDATVYLGPDFAAFAKGNKKYTETPDQEAQVAMLFLGRTDVFVGDINIFKYFKKTTKKIEAAQKTGEVVHAIFPPTAYKVAFVDKQVRDDFNAGLKQLKDSGEYAKIVAKYVGD